MREVISDIRARQVLDSRGNPTVEADVFLQSGFAGRAIVPSGASTGTGEALELRDNDKNYNGKSVSRAVWNVNHTIRDILVGNPAEQNMVDSMMLELDGSENKSELGANAILAVSLATARAVARSRHMFFCQYVAELADTQMSLPMPMMNVMNGGAHANFSTDFQEYMIVPVGAGTMNDAVRMGAEVFHALKKFLADRSFATTVGDEGGFAPKMRDNNEPFECIVEAIRLAGYKVGEDIAIALDIAASEFVDNEKYVLKTNEEVKSSDDLINWYDELVKKYPVVSIEDGLGENDWEGWKVLTEKLDNIQLVGDDLFVTSCELLRRGIGEKVANAILIKPNQIGTLTETIAAVKLAKSAGYKTIISHRSGETEDVSIAHLAVGLGAGQIKTGSMSRTDRIAKYNELMRLAEFMPELKLENPFQK